MRKRLAELLTLIVVILSVGWVGVSPGFEAVVALAVALCVAVPLQLRSRSLVSVTAGALRNCLRPKRPGDLPEATVTFQVQAGETLQTHRVEAIRLYAKGEMTERVVLEHDTPVNQPYWIDEIEGYSVELLLVDFDGDSIPELAVRYACGAHSRGLRLFKLDNGLLKPVPGSSLGSDWPEITWEDRDRDGKMEIYMKNRNWTGSPTEEYVEDVYVYRTGGYERRSAGG